jgi:hypothetical protein
MFAPSWHASGHKRLEQAAVRWHSEMQQFVGDDEILKTGVLFNQILGKGNDAGRRTGAPFAGHPLYADHSSLNP